MSNLDVLIPADNECAYEKGWQDAVDVIIKQMTIQRNKLLMPVSQEETQILAMLNARIDSINQVKDIQNAIAWTKDHSLANGELHSEVKNDT